MRCFKKLFSSSVFYLGILLLLLWNYSCQQKATPFSDNQVFRYNESANISSLDPAFSKVQSNIWACNQIFNGLVQLDDLLNIQPDIAKSWNISEDGLVYEFFLREDVFFHEHSAFGSSKTRKVNAHDFEFSFQRLLDNHLVSPGRWILQQVESFHAINDSVFQIRLVKPFPAFLGLLSMKYASVVPKEVLNQSNHDFRTHPIGTGPFYVKLWEENVKLVLRKNKRYFEKDENGFTLPYLEAVAISFLPDKQSGFMEFLQGKIDFVSGLDPSYKDELLTKTGELQSKYQDKIQMATGPYLNTEYLGFNLDSTYSKPIDIRLRKALNYGFDRQKMIAYLRNNMGIPATSGIIPAGMPGFNGQTGYDYNPQKAKDYIQSFQRIYGQNLPTIVLSTNPTYMDIAEFLQREWQKIGLRVQIDSNPPATLRQAIATGKVSFFRASWIADYPEAENYLSLFYKGNFSPNGPNYTHFSNPDYDVLYQKAFIITSAEERLEYYQKMDSIIIHHAPIVPLFYDKVVRFSQKNVSGLGMNPLNLLSLKKVRKIKTK